VDLNVYNFYKNRVAFNFLAKDADNGKDVYDALEGNAFIGVLSKQFKTVEEGVAYIKEFNKKVPQISVGLGAGDPNQWKAARDIAGEVNPAHVNQVYTTAAYTQGYLRGKGCKNTIVNSLMSPTGTPGKVRIATGPVSSKLQDGVVDVDTALSMMKDSGVNSVKFFDIHGDSCLEELKVVAEACARNGIQIIEPTGGITAENIVSIVKVCLETGVEKIIPHVYSSAIDKSTGLTNIDIVKDIYEKIKKLL
jgi:2-dehydro-3-deoxy-phosphogluconate aldolase